MSPQKLEDIIPPSRRKKVESEAVVINSAYNKKPRARRGGGLLLIIIVVLGLAGGGFYAAATIFKTSHITVVPTTKDVVVDTEITATRTKSEPGVHYDVIRVEKVAKQSVPATGSTQVSTKASGVVVVSNNFSSAPQHWVARTRFEAPNGKIFRIRKPLTIPGKNGDTPGTVEVTIYADEPGEDYNVGMTNFTIPGLKGTPQFDAITATSKTPIQGGFVGAKPVVSDADTQKTRTSLQNALKNDIAQTLADQVPSGFVLLPGASVVSFESLPPTSEDSKSAVLREKATATGVIFPATELAGNIAQSVIKNYDGEQVTFGSTKDLVLTPISSLLSAEEDGIFSFKLKGRAVLTYVVDKAKVLSAIAGKDREAAKRVLSSIPSIDTARITLRPFWRKVLPAKADDISFSISQSPQDSKK